ncbi:MAG: uroporphyrinogen decarboxylase family protein [Phycisphaerae bacterium]|nr:uroporphyrinogen decarboxylase family protein [Phycisphaerae bacterium]
MSYERGMAAIRLEAPDEIPHTQYITHPEWLEHLRKKAGKPNAGFEELLDFDFRWSADGPNIERGRWTDMGHALWQPDGSDFHQSVPSPFTDLEEIYHLDPLEEYGPVDVERQAEAYQAWYAEARKGTGVISGGTYRSVLSFAIAAFGWENLLVAAGTDPHRFGETLNRWADYLLENYVRAWARTDIEVFLTHDDFVWTSGGFLQPDFYRTYVFPNYRRYWDCIKDAGKKVLFCSDGNFTQYVDDLADAGAEGFIFEPTTDLQALCTRYGKTHVIVGNADCRVLTFGTPEEVRAEVKRCMDVGRDCPGYFFAVGNHIPPNVPIENADACLEAYRDLRRR